MNNQIKDLKIEVNVNCIEGFGGKALIVDTRSCLWSRYKVRMLDGSQPDFWAHDFEIDEIKEMGKILYKDIQLKDIKPLGVFGDVFRFEARDNEKTDQIYFTTEIFTNNTEEAIQDIVKELYDKDLYLVKVQLGIVVIIEQNIEQYIKNPEIVNPETQEIYVLFVEKNPSIAYSDTPF